MANARYSGIYAFGDSLSDAGNVSIATANTLPVSPPYYRESYGPFGLIKGAVFSNGPVWVQDLSRSLGLGTLAPSLAGGNDFAYGGAEATATASTLSGLAQSVTSLSSQLVQFQLGGGGSSSGLYTVSIGTNDIYSILSETGVDLAKQTGQIANAVSSEMSFITSLIGDGAKYLLALDVPDMGHLPAITEENNAATDSLASRLSNLYNVDLNTGLENLARSSGATINILPLYSLADQAIASPSSFGLTDVTDPAWTGNFTSSSSGTLAASPNTYLFWDDYHPTEPVQTDIANDAKSLVTTGSQLYPEPTVQMTDGTTGLNSVQYGTVVSGAAGGLQGQFLYPGLDPVTIRASSPAMFLLGGPSNDALQATSGSNVLDGAGGSNFLVGATGADGGTDTFYTDARTGGFGWDTYVNFHAGDNATLWGFTPGVSSWSWVGVAGASGYTGATLNANVSGDGTVERNITFDGLSITQAENLQVTTGTIGGTPYLLLHNAG